MIMLMEKRNSFKQLAVIVNRNNNQILKSLPKEMHGIKLRTNQLKVKLQKEIKNRLIFQGNLVLTYSTIKIAQIQHLKIRALANQPTTNKDKLAIMMERITLIITILSMKTISNLSVLTSFLQINTTQAMFPNATLSCKVMC